MRILAVNVLKECKKKTKQNKKPKKLVIRLIQHLEI